MSKEQSESENSEELVQDIDKLNTLIRSKKRMHKILSTEYFLPKLNSRAITKDYLKSLALEPIPIFTIKRKEINPLPEGMESQYSTAELHEKLEKFLAEKNLKPSGMNIAYLPNRKWLLTVFLNLDPENSYKIFGKKLEDGIITRKINNKFLELIKDIPPQKKGKAFFNLTPEEKFSQQVKKIERKVKKKDKKMMLYHEFLQKTQIEKEVLNRKKEKKFKQLKDQNAGMQNIIEINKEEEFAKQIDKCIKENYSEKGGKVTPGLIAKFGDIYLKSPSVVFEKFIEEKEEKEHKFIK